MGDDTETMARPTLIYYLPTFTGLQKATAGCPARERFSPFYLDW